MIIFARHGKLALNLSPMREAILTTHSSVGDLLLLDVTPLSLGIEDIHGQMNVLIRRNSTVPTRTQAYSVFTNAYAYQTTATIRIFEGEHHLTKYNVCHLLYVLTLM